jgi:5-hydroxyisourate hydrolase
MRSPITTHVLDLGNGRPGEGIRIVLRVKEKEGEGEPRWREVGSGVTDADGRVENLLPAAAHIEPGTYSLTFSASPSSPSKKSSLSPFFPEITITFEVTDPSAHTHVPLLLSPYGYSTYRGS